jgi:hypothetical protein
MSWMRVRRLGKVWCPLNCGESEGGQGATRQMTYSRPKTALIVIAKVMEVQTGSRQMGYTCQSDVG